MFSYGREMVLLRIGTTRSQTARKISLKFVYINKFSKH